MITREEAQTGLSIWEWREAGVSMQLVQRLPIRPAPSFRDGDSPVKLPTLSGAPAFFRPSSEMMEQNP